MPRFLRNTWYVAAWSEELTADKPLARTILGAPVVMFRAADGSAVALQDRCPHRFAPLHRGAVVNGAIKCAYHGLTFDGAGKCVHNPHDRDQGARQPSVAAYAIEERQGIVWIWVGDQGRVDRSAAPLFDRLDAAENFVGRSYLHGQAYYELMSDNILDLSHIEFLHPGLGTEAVSRAEVESRAVNGAVVTSRRMTDETLPPRLAKIYRTNGAPVNRTMEVVWQAPANLVLTVTIEPVDPGQNWRTGSQSLHLYTPETERTTHYFFTGSLPRANADDEIFQQFFGSLERAFTTEDKPIIDAQQAALGDDDVADLHPHLLPIDRANVMARRTLGKLIAAEQSLETVAN